MWNLNHMSKIAFGLQWKKRHFAKSHGRSSLFLASGARAGYRRRNHMSANRQDFLRDLTLGTVGAGVIATSLNAADRSASAGFLTKEPSMKLGMVTYQLGQDWSLDTI